MSQEVILTHDGIEAEPRSNLALRGEAVMVALQEAQAVEGEECADDLLRRRLI
jgi:hypothetical protein